MWRRMEFADRMKGIRFDCSLRASFSWIFGRSGAKKRPKAIVYGMTPGNGSDFARLKWF